jgi:ribosome biogenesis GTPase
VIHHVLDRRTVLVRRAASSDALPQVVAANVDVFLIVTSANLELNPRRLERYVTAVWDSGAVPVIVLNKLDLVVDPAPLLEDIESIAPGVTVLGASAHAGDGTGELARFVTPGTTVGFIGSSGVGKSSLINRLRGAEARATGAIGNDDKGRHTTTRRELVVLPGGGIVIDTPGMRELGMVGDTSGLDTAFAEIAERAEHCQFRDCRHEGEPDCAVRDAVETGALPRERLDSYHKLKRELAAAEVRSDPRVGANSKRRMKAISRQLRSFDRLSDKRRR